MKRKKPIILFITIILLSFTGSPSGIVEFVYDGDTILLRNGKKIRYIGIDAPEIGYEGEESEFMALASREHNLQLVYKRPVRFEFDRVRKDRYERLLAYVFIENGEMVNVLMVRRGFARVMVIRPNLKYLPTLLNAQRRAMKEKIGVWRKEPRGMEGYYNGSSKSYRFHRPGCPFGKKIRPNNLIRFKSRNDAFWEGFSPCKQCRP